ncbi:MAG TPA: oxidoreductase [Puia sp.]
MQVKLFSHLSGRFRPIIWLPVILLLSLAIPLPSAAQKKPAGSIPGVRVLISGLHNSFRGLSVVTDKIVWVSGSNGIVGRSLDGGTTWQWIAVPGYEKRDFRDIEAFDAKTALIMAVDEPGDLLKTSDGGKTWKNVYENNTPGMFLDAMEFWNFDSGIVIGDPIKGKFFVARSFDGGDSWHEITARELPAADSGEACFAASGTNVRKLDKESACFVSGGLRSRLFIRDQQIDLPIIQGKNSTGANSIAIQDNQKLHGGRQLVIVGGDFANDTAREKNCAITDDGGKTWISPAEPPHGYRSCVEFIGKDRLLCCGISGVDISTDGGMHWRLISSQGFHVCRKAKKGKAVFLAGGGLIARLAL